MDKFNRILLIDDDPIQNLINTKLMRRLDMCDRIDVAVNGKAAFEEYLGDQRPDYDIIFLDINMPIMNGWEFLDVLKEKGFEDLPRIYMLTSSISPDDIEKSQAHPMVENYITKPLNLQRLEDLKNKLLSEMS
jgi:CheY-like chemotaxis protein